MLALPPDLDFVSVKGSRAQEKLVGIARKRLARRRAFQSRRGDHCWCI
jgi:hypothetical protein